ncbi:hypothetical protein ANME2D_01428 [Candidatus Methanoperedens nitroreducens]|uniref:Uncharacterized protein n=1 Tax=Candidatus Methanoperedens nitratireducens TaxID=1392998 RepID=A0A062V633_9EURY|nr:hypothetical protein ANME2D_01428 [Candidatus Methanoperedens nitroreducens]
MAPAINQAGFFLRIPATEMANDVIIPGHPVSSINIVESKLNLSIVCWRAHIYEVFKFKDIS